jgi:hypothetical protein
VLSLVAKIAASLDVLVLHEGVQCNLGHGAGPADVVGNVVRRDEEIKDAVNVEVLAKTLVLAARLSQHVLGRSQGKERHRPSILGMTVLH